MLKYILIFILISIIFVQIILPTYKNITADEFIKNFSQEEALEDYDYVWDMMEEHYPLFYVGKRAGIDYERLRDSYRNMIFQQTDISYKGFYNIMIEMMSDLKYIGHLNIYNANSYKMLRDSFDSIDLNDYGKFYKYLVETLNNEKSVKGYDYLSGVSNPLNNLIYDFYNEKR